MRSVLFLAALWAVPIATAQETVETAAPEEQDDRVTLTGLVQTQFNTSSEDQEVTDLFLRRVRLGAEIQVAPRVTGRIDAELANAATGGSAELNEAYAQIELVPGANLLVGKGGRPFGIVDATGAGVLTPIERGAAFRDATAIEQYRTLEAIAYAGRSVGVQLQGDVPGLPVGLAYAAGYFNGSTGEEGASADIQQLAARVAVTPMPILTIGLAATSRDVGIDERPGFDADGAVTGGDPSGEIQRAAAFAVDVEIGENGQPGPRLLAEVAGGTLDPFADHRFVSAQGWAAWRVRVAAPLVDAVEPLFRASWTDNDGPLGQFDGTLLTPGVNVYLAERTRAMLNLDVFLPGADTPGDPDTLFALRSQVQIAF